MKVNMKNLMLITTVLIAFIVCGCNTTKPAAPLPYEPVPVQGAEPWGFPLIDIVDAQVEVANDSQFAGKAEVAWVRGPNTKIIGGTQGTQIAAKDITIRLIETSIQVPIREGADLTSWFLNIPAGLKATAHALNRDSKFAAEKNATQITITIEGTPLETINQPVRIRVPYEVTNREWDFVLPANNDIRFEVYGADVASIVVGGAIGREIDSKTFKIKFGGTKLASTIALNTDISTWFTNLPSGLKAVVNEETPPAAEGQQSLTIVISGTPIVQSTEKMNVLIPARITTAGIDLRIPASDKARYDIGSYQVIPQADMGLMTGSNWKGAISGWGLTGPQVFQMKDFTSRGIIQITAQSTYAIGDDGEYHWNGEVITYGKLMTEARKLEAHAIIDVVIDHDDKVTKTIERRHVEADHVNSPLEQLKIEKNLITVEVDPNGGQIYVEEITVTRRTSTGTALAIQYAPAAQPGTGSYVPAYKD